MAVTKERIQEIVREHGTNDQDSGSSAVQIAILTEKIRDLTEHLKIHRKDLHSRRGLQEMVNKRNKLLKYVYNCSHDDYRNLVGKLGIRAKLTRHH